MIRTSAAGMAFTLLVVAAGCARSSALPTLDARGGLEMSINTSGDTSGDTSVGASAHDGRAPEASAPDAGSRDSRAEALRRDATTADSSRSADAYIGMACGLNTCSASAPHCCYPVTCSPPYCVVSCITCIRTGGCCL